MFAGLKVAERGLEKDLVTMSPFALNLMIIFAMQEELEFFNICVPEIIPGNRRDASWMHLKGY